jgi:hypothetical protein
MNHTMAHGDRGGKAHLLGSREHRFNCRRMVGEIAMLIHQIFVVRGLDPEMSV